MSTTRGAWTHEIILVCIVMAGVVAACTQREPKTVAFVLKTLSNPYFIAMKDGIDSLSQSRRIAVTVQATPKESDVVQQVDMVNAFIDNQTISAICITPNSSEAIVPSIVRANRRRLPVVIVDTKVDSAAMARQGATIQAFIGSDNRQGARLAASILVEAIAGNGEVGILEGVPGQETAQARSEGFREEISRHAGVKLVARQAADWDRERAYSASQAMLLAHPGLVGLFASNDEMALGAIRAIQDAKREVVVVGFDATDEARKAVEDGFLAATIAQDPVRMGAEALAMADSLAKGLPVTTFVLLSPIPVKKR